MGGWVEGIAPLAGLLVLVFVTSRNQVFDSAANISFLKT